MTPENVAGSIASPQTLAEDAAQGGRRLALDETDAWVDGGVAG